jgi:hypothetical protein
MHAYRLLFLGHRTLYPLGPIVGHQKTIPPTGGFLLTRLAMQVPYVVSSW